LKLYMRFLPRIECDETAKKPVVPVAARAEGERPSRIPIWVPGGWFDPIETRSNGVSLSPRYVALSGDGKDLAVASEGFGLLSEGEEEIPFDEFHSQPGIGVGVLESCADGIEKGRAFRPGETHGRKLRPGDLKVGEEGLPFFPFLFQLPCLLKGRFAGPCRSRYDQK